MNSAAEEPAVAALKDGALRAIRVKEYPYDLVDEPPIDSNPHSAEMTTFDLARIFQSSQAPLVGDVASTLDAVISAVGRTTDSARLRRRHDWVVAELTQAGFSAQARAFSDVLGPHIS